MIVYDIHYNRDPVIVEALDHFLDFFDTDFALEGIG